MPDRKKRRIAQYPSTDNSASTNDHPFLTPHGLRMQMQGSQVDKVVPLPLPDYPQPFDSQTPVPPVALDPFHFDRGENASLINFLPSKKFPHPESLARQPLTPYFDSRPVSSTLTRELRCVGRLFIQISPDPRHELASGSAWISGTNTIVTCAHNVYEFMSGTWSRALEFHPGYDYYAKHSLPKCRVTRCRIPRNYLANPAVNHDIAICEVDRYIGDVIGATIPTRPIESNDFFETNPVAIVGYPAGSSFDFGNQMWQSIGDYLFGQSGGGETPYAPVMATNFGGGASGCPWLVKEPFTGEYVAVGVTSGHAKLRYRRGEANLMSLVSPFFSPHLFEQLESDGVTHEFL